MGLQRFGDQVWELAQRRDVAGLERAAALHLRDESGIEYEGYRARAFALAVQGRTNEALQALNEGWTEEWPTPVGYSMDVTRVHYLSGNARKAIAALQLDLRTFAQLPGAVELAAACARLDPRVKKEALRVVRHTSSGTERLRAMLAVAFARRRSLGDAQQDLAQLTS
jgi:hypothetical protein